MQGVSGEVGRAHLLRVNMRKRVQPGKTSDGLRTGSAQSIMPTTEHYMRLRLAYETVVLGEGSRGGCWARPRARH